MFSLTIPHFFHIFTIFVCYSCTQKDGLHIDVDQKRRRNEMKNKPTPINDFKNEGRTAMERPFMVTIFFIMLMDLVFLVFMGLWATTASAEIGGEIPPLMDYETVGGRLHPGMMPDFPGMRWDGRRPESMMAEEHLLWRPLEELGLDEKQKKELREIKGRLIKEMIRKRADEQIAGIELKEILDKDPVDMKSVETKLKRIETIRTEMHLAPIRATEEIKTKLTSDQRKKLQERLKMDFRTRQRDRMD
ncbi:MAG: hypothetical protein V2B13_11085 [Pseudomonadota bacterium]